MVEEYFLAGVIIGLFWSFSSSQLGQQDSHSRPRLLLGSAMGEVPPQKLLWDQQVDRRAEGLWRVMVWKPWSVTISHPGVLPNMTMQCHFRSMSSLQDHIAVCWVLPWPWCGGQTWVAEMLREPGVCILVYFVTVLVLKIHFRNWVLSCCFWMSIHSHWL